MIGVAPTKNTSLYEQEQTASGNKTGVFAYNLLMAAMTSNNDTCCTYVLWGERNMGTMTNCFL